jgi:UDP-N-acetylmuramyl tripeptide synthase
MLEKGDTTGPISAEYILKDPTVEFAVLETARGGILRSGLGFSRCDIAVITNIQEDHLGLSDIHTLEDLAGEKHRGAQCQERWLGDPECRRPAMREDWRRTQLQRGLF